MTDYCVFVFETFIQMGSSVVLMQHRFHTHFNVGRHGAIPSRNIILKWVKNFRTTGSVRPGTAWGGDQTKRTQENIKRVRQAVETSSCWSAVWHAHALQMSDRSVH
jgi:transposase